jgi:hypothetical protein
MEFIKQEIRNFTWKAKNTMQFTLEDTITIPEDRLDMERLVLVKGNVIIEETQAQVSRFQVKGQLHYQLLYCSDKEGAVFDSLTGDIPFVEYINADGTKEGDYIEVYACLHDLTVAMLHSRKVSLKALIGLDYQVKEAEEFAAITEVEGTEELSLLKDTISMVTLRLQEKEELQIEEKIELPASKPNLYQLIWKSMTITGTQVKPGDGYLLASGVLNVFLVYTAQEDGAPLQYLTMEVPFEQRITEELSSEDMISGSFLSLNQYHITVVPDENGEDRLLELAAELTMEVKLYGGEDLTLVKDAYSTEEEVTPQWKDFTAQQLLLRNCAKTKVSDVVELPKQQAVLQICNVEGSVSIDDTERTPKGILVEGVVGTQITYLGREDGTLASATFDLPFSYEIEVNGMGEEVTYSIVPFLDHIAASRSGENQVEIKAEVSLEVLAFTNERVRAVLDMTAAPVNAERKQAMPGIVGYIVRKNDTLWGIAKDYDTTVERIRELNSMETDGLKEGDRLLLVK